MKYIRPFKKINNKWSLDIISIVPQPSISAALWISHQIETAYFLILKEGKKQLERTLPPMQKKEKLSH